MSGLVLLGVLVIALGAAALLSSVLAGLMPVSTAELKRRGDAGDTEAKLVYPLRARGHELLILITVLKTVAMVTSALTLKALMPGDGFWAAWLAIIATVLAISLTELVPSVLLRDSGIWVAARLALPLNWALEVLRPLLMPPANWFERHLGTDTLPRFHSRAELIEALEEHQPAKDSDLESQAVRAVKGALSFGSKTVGEVMTPRSVMVTVKHDQVLSPATLKKLHDSGHSRIPVVKDDQVTGLLYLHELVEHKKDKLTAGAAAERKVHYVNQNEDLSHLLDAFLKTRHHLFVVVNEFEETVGVVTVEDVLEQLLGQRIVDEFDQYADLRAVAAKRKNS